MRWHVPYVYLTKNSSPMVIKDSYELGFKRQNQNVKWSKDLSRHLIKEASPMASVCRRGDHHPQSSGKRKCKITALC